MRRSRMARRSKHRAASESAIAAADGRLRLPRADNGRPTARATCRRRVNRSTGADTAVSDTVSMSRTRAGADATSQLPSMSCRVPPPPVNPLAGASTRGPSRWSTNWPTSANRAWRRSRLWGTHDGGQTWQSYAVDDDNRSPLRGDGRRRRRVWFFDRRRRAPAAEAACRRKPGDTPALWVDVDLAAADRADPRR